MTYLLTTPVTAEFLLLLMADLGCGATTAVDFSLLGVSSTK